MLLRESDQSIELKRLSIIGDHAPRVTPKHLMHLARDDGEIGPRRAIFEGHKIQIKPSFRIGELPWAHIVVRIVREFHLVQFVNASLQNQTVLGRGGEIAKSTTQVQANRPPIGQETRGAGPVPKTLILPHAASPIERAKRFVGT